MEGLSIPIADLLGRPGEYRDFTLSPSLGGIRSTLASLTEQPLDVGLRAESVVEGILVTGRVKGTTALECARCLRGFRSTTMLEICELFAAPGHEGPEEEDSYRLSGEELHLEPMLRDSLALALPLNPVCSPECKGLCGQCGTDLNDGACQCSQDEMDPRWAALSALRERLEA